MELESCPVDQVTAGFDETVKEQIVSYLHPQETQEKRGKPVLENWQKSYENGEYLKKCRDDRRTKL